MQSQTRTCRKQHRVSDGHCNDERLIPATKYNSSKRGNLFRFLDREHVADTDNSQRNNFWLCIIEHAVTESFCYPIQATFIPITCELQLFCWLRSLFCDQLRRNSISITSKRFHKMWYRFQTVCRVFSMSNTLMEKIYRGANKEENPNLQVILNLITSNLIVLSGSKKTIFQNNETHDGRARIRVDPFVTNWI